jgi:hypothetical protein
MAMTYFAFTSDPWKCEKLKIAIVFVHEGFRFEVWISGASRKAQAKYWKLIKDSKWTKYRIPSTTKGVDYILKDVLVDNPDFSDLDT